MVQRTLIALDNSILTIAAGSPSGTPGNPIINNSDTPNGTIFDYVGGFAPQSVLIDDLPGGGTSTLVFEDDETTRHSIIDGQGLVADGTAVESESRIDLRALDAFGNPTGPTISVFVFSQNGNFSDVWGVGLTAPLVPGTQYVKVSGSNLGDSIYTNFVPCFVAGTRIRGDRGLCAVEDLRPGDAVWTPEGPRAVRWTGLTTVDGSGARAPVEIAPGFLGNTRTLCVSPQHRMVVDSWQADLLFGTPEVLVAAIHLLGHPKVRRAPRAAVDYVHFLCDAHVLVEAEGALSESFYPGDMALGALGSATQAELLSLFPELANGVPCPMALPALRGHEAQVLTATLR